MIVDRLSSEDQDSDKAESLNESATVPKRIAVSAPRCCALVLDYLVSAPSPPKSVAHCWLLGLASARAILLLSPD